jgi:gamma-glutamyltranspeptidase
MTSISPILVTDFRGTVIFTAGGSGGSRIISSVAQVAIYNLWLGKSIRDSVDMPRLHQQLIPMEVELEKRFPVVRDAFPFDSLSRLRCRMWFTVCWRKVTRSRVSEVVVWFKRSNDDMRMSCGR